MVHESVLPDFLVRAKKNGYASKSKSPQKLIDGSYEYVYRESSMSYRNKYFGSEVFTGQELVFHEDKLMWSMAYRGGIVQGFEILSKKCYAFLKTCLRKVPFESPIRGPKKYKKGNFLYTNVLNGNLIDFVGIEKIYWKKQLIYFCNYFGGKAELRNSNVAS